jgi:hypothetical protein
VSLIFLCTFGLKHFFLSHKYFASYGQEAPRNECKPSYKLVLFCPILIKIGMCRQNLVILYHIKYRENGFLGFRIAHTDAQTYKHGEANKSIFCNFVGNPPRIDVNLGRLKMGVAFLSGYFSVVMIFRRLKVKLGL